MKKVKKKFGNHVFHTTTFPVRRQLELLPFIMEGLGNEVGSLVLLFNKSNHAEETSAALQAAIVSALSSVVRRSTGKGQIDQILSFFEQTEVHMNPEGQGGVAPQLWNARQDFDAVFGDNLILMIQVWVWVVRVNFIDGLLDILPKITRGTPSSGSAKVRSRVANSPTATR